MSTLNDLLDDVDLDAFVNNVNTMDTASCLPAVTENTNTCTTNIASSRHEFPSTSTDIEHRITQQIPQKTLENGKWACKTFNEWIKARNEKILNTHSSALMFLSESGHATLSDLSRDGLNSALQHFVFEVRKKNGLKYPSDSLRQLVCGINFWLKKKENRNWNIFSDSGFEGARMALDSAMKETAREGNNNKPKRAVPITQEQEEDLWNRGYLGDDNPKKLNRTLLYLLSIHCGLRGGAELRQLTYGQNENLSLKLENNTEILEYNENVSKNNNHGLRLELHMRKIKKYLKKFQYLSVMQLE